MKFNPSLHLALGIFSLYTLSVSPHSLSTDSPQIHELLPKYGLPIGLLPDSVKSYTLSDDGTFSVDLETPCYVQFEYLVYYDKKITGKLSYGSILGLRGIEFKQMFLWLEVDEIRVDLPPSDSIYFRAGIVSKKFDVDQFNTIHSCRANKISGPWNRMLKLPAPVEDIQMLITE